MPAPIVHINGHAGSGKLTIARALQAKMPGARLLDNHTLLDPARALFDRETSELRALRETIRDTVFRAADQLAPTAALILTDALDDSTYAMQIFDMHVTAFARRTQRALYRIILDLDEAENVRRLQSPDRLARRKLMDPDILVQLRAQHRLLGAEEAEVLHLDVTSLTADQAACGLLGHLETLGAVHNPATTL